MKTRMTCSVAAVAALLGSGLAATTASAGCGDGSWMKPAAMRDGDGDGAVLVKAASPALAPIVGTWSVTFTDNTGKVSDFGYQSWHSDGTEILNSGGRSPASGNFCLGAWKPAANNGYLLSHWALSYDPGTGKLNAKVSIREYVMVDAGGLTFSGSYTQDVFDPSGTKLVHLGGAIKGERVVPQ